MRESSEVTRVVGYRRVSTAEQAASGLGKEAQQLAIQAECERRGWTLVTTLEDDASGKSMKNRPGLAAAIQIIEAGGAEVLMVAKLDRMARSTLDFAETLERANSRGWKIVALDTPIDMTTPHGEAMAGMAMIFAQLERKLIGQRTRDALAVKRSQGVQLGDPRKATPAVVKRVARLRAEGLTLAAIASLLNEDGVPTAHGGRMWRPSSVAAVLRRAEQPFAA